ncbi:hypothetical protein KY334_02850 [Candidatus Woesearchaeota archaeon]|nr:hypothetical protein [Candidatus Woesearchaeota archaeon]
MNYSFQVLNYGHWYKILWFCKIAMIVAAIGFIFKKRVLINIVLIASFVAQSRWILDFILQFLGMGMGRNEWIVYGDTFLIILSIIMHSVLIPICFYGTYKLGFDKKSLKYSILLFSVVLLIISFLVTESNQNINCISYPCDLNYNEDFDIIENSGFYFTYKYLIYNVVFWSFFIYLSYLLMNYLFMKVKYLNKNNNL